MLVTSIFSFSCNVLKMLLSHMRQKVSLYWEWVNPFPIIPRVLMTLRKRAFRKLSGKKRKCSIFSFSPTIFSIHLKNLFCLSHFWICSLQMQSFWTRLKSWNIAKGLTLSQTPNLRLFQTEGVCRQQFQI